MILDWNVKKMPSEILFLAFALPPFRKGSSCRNSVYKYRRISGQSQNDSEVYVKPAAIQVLQKKAY